MDNLRRVGQYFRSPLVVCGTLQTVVPHPVFHGIEDLPDSFYKLFGRQWGHISTLKKIFDADPFILDGAIDAFEARHQEDPSRQLGIVESTRRDVFHMLGLPGVSGYEDHWSENVTVMLREGKTVVPFVLNFDGTDLVQSMESKHGYSLTGTAEGEGFTCSVFRKPAHESCVPVYIITGEMDVSADEFHALVCDVSYRHNWDDQFHYATAVEVENSISMVEWVVKWPWPLAPREYRYLLSPHKLDDGTNLVVAASVRADNQIHPSSVPVREYFGITAAKNVGPSRCRYCVFYYDDPRLPGRMPGWLEQYVTKQLLPSFPKKVLAGARIYPKDRLEHYSQLSSSTESIQITCPVIG